MKFQHRHGCVILGIAENTREMRAISPHPLGFLDGQFFNAIMQKGRSGRMPSSHRARREFAEFVQIIEVFPRAFAALSKR